MAMTSQNTPESRPECNPFAVDVEDVNYVNRILLTIIKSKLTLESSENVNTLNLLELYNKYPEDFNEKFSDHEYEYILVRGKLLEDRWRRRAQTNNTNTILCRSIEVVVIDADEDVKDKFTFPRISACIAYNYYEHVVSKLDNLEEMIIPSLIAGCSPLPILDNTDAKDNLKYHKLFCLAVTGVHFIPKMIKNAGKPDDLIGGVFTICLLIDYIQYKKEHPDDNVDFKTFLSSVLYEGDRNTFINAVINYGSHEFVELMAKKSFKMLELFMEHLQGRLLP